MKFLTDNRRFSFVYDGKDAFETPFTKTEERTDDTLTSVYSFEKGLRITNSAKFYPDYGAYEWVNTVENTGEEPTGLIEKLLDCDCEIPVCHMENRRATPYLPDKESLTMVYSHHGSGCSDDEFQSDTERFFCDKYKNSIFPGEKGVFFSPVGGRSCDGCAPFFNVKYPGGGFIVAVGWTGQWNCSFQRTNDSVRVKSGLEDSHFRLLPHEKFRTSSVVIMPYEGDRIDGQNKWRRFAREHVSAKPQGGHLPLCCGIWGGMNTSDAIERLEYVKKQKIPYECVWMDAGWYGAGTNVSPDEYTGDWWQYTGDWRVNKTRHPDGLLEFRKAVEDLGVPFLLWFEPARVRDNSPIFAEHPEYVISLGENDANKLLNFGDEKAREYCLETVSEIIRKLRINVYRQDYNFMPLSYWRGLDDEDRKGISELKYVNGEYEYLDALLARFPGLMIDNCASGGRRIDIEMMKRSFPFWRSDAECSANYVPEVAQAQASVYPQWLPYSGTGGGRETDTYRFRSAYANGLTTNWFFSASNDYKAYDVKWIRKMCLEFRSIRPYLDGDIYPLGGNRADEDSWCAIQYDRPECGDGMVQVFKREKAPYTDACYKLCGLRSEKTYKFTDLDGGSFTVSGRELCENGLKLHIEGQRVAKIYVYEEVR